MGQTTQTSTLWVLHKRKKKLFPRMLKLQKLESVSSKISDGQLLPQVSVRPHKFTGEIRMKPLPPAFGPSSLETTLSFCPPLSFQVCSFIPLSGCKSHSCDLGRCSESWKVWIQSLFLQGENPFLCKSCLQKCTYIYTSCSYNHILFETHLIFISL